MLNIDEKQLQLLLEERKKFLERPRYEGFGEIISGISMIITLILSDFSHLTFFNPIYFEIVVWGISIAVLLYGIYIFIKSIIAPYSIKQLYSEIADIDPDMEHPFDIIVIRDIRETGKYLLFWSKRWKCWFFPNYRCSQGRFNKENEASNIKKYLKRDLDLCNSEKINLIYMGNILDPKFSASDKVQKKYNFHFFVVIDSDFHSLKKRRFKYIKRTCFKLNGRKYCWKTMDQMYADKRIVKKNKNVVDYVRNKCDIS